jgi:hypothetical protein
MLAILRTLDGCTQQIEVPRHEAIFELPCYGQPPIRFAEQDHLIVDRPIPKRRYRLVKVAEVLFYEEEEA